MIKKIIFGLYNQLSHRSQEYQNHIRDITKFSYNLLVEQNKEQVENIVESNDINIILEESAAKDADWLFVVSYGFIGRSPINVYELAETAFSNNYSILGHILDDEPYGKKYYSLHNQTILININDWIRAGKPRWSTGDCVSELILHSIDRSNENYHDDYTPHWIKPGVGSKKITGNLREGWSLINGFILAGMNIGNFPENIRDLKKHIYPEHGFELELILAGNDNIVPFEESQKKWLNNLSQKDNNVYIFNTCPLDKEELNIQKLDNLYSVAAGFKPLLLLHQCVWDNNTRVVYFDRNVKALNFKKWLLEYWDGNDYPSIVEFYKKNVDTEMNGIWHFLDRDQYQEWKAIIERFGGQDEWINFWNEYKKIPHRFLKIDLFNDYNEILVDMKQNGGNNLIWFSNVFYSSSSLRYLNPTNLNKSYFNFINDIKLYNKSIHLIGYDNQGKSVSTYMGEIVINH